MSHLKLSITQPTTPGSHAPTASPSPSQVIGGFLKDHRVAKGLSPMDVVSHLELESVESLFQFETGQAEIPLQTLFAFANLYAVSPDQLVLLLYKQALRST